MRILGFIVLIAVVVIALGQSFLIDIASLIIVLGLTLACLLSSFGGGIGTGFKAVFSNTADRDTILLGIAMFERGKSMAVMSGGIMGTFIGLIIMLKNMDDPAALGPGMALGFLTTLYSLVLGYGVFAPLGASLRQKLEESEA
ncbi:MAG: hypothetical protein HOC74_02695 [Gemmatimonadetes bacterium]|jgi:flagellar motor component MotA|nr:hypothetical protein [Gemmatimonadota bacterium]